MSTNNHFKTAKELKAIADSKSGLPDDTGGMGLMLPKKPAQQLTVAIFFYRTSIAGGKYKMFPPHYIMELDPVTGNVVQFRQCTPKDFGVTGSLHEPVYVTEFQPKPDPKAKDFFLKNQRFDEISPIVWNMYDAENSVIEPSKKAQVREYQSLFNDIAKKELLPYYNGLTPEFFNWLAQTSK